jgi:hypothetical protein
VPNQKQSLRKHSTAGKLFIQGHYIFLNEVDKGIHVIDNSNPAQPRNVAFIDIPGNVDLAVKGNTCMPTCTPTLSHWIYQPARCKSDVHCRKRISAPLLFAAIMVWTLQDYYGLD